ncbi:ArsR/SmtB family transcription factor [Streptomyces sp. NPDC012600]|uniref:Winged helix-turn-helix domain-containing protein n=1 Tax=Streptomyces stephensoniae TaxID=3375367 RepID=A0ABU2WA18_9ACTN|nr:winged helix-turn-helix domain-containing protein [Streptomyces griseus]MDT0494702.1 winged helix-turn-helix domain-containing protein [Streptomyces griseus]
MELEQRVAELERRLTALERRDREAPRLGDGDFWALNGLKQQLADVGEAAADGGVLFTGAVRLPTGEQYEWQYGALTGALLDGEGGDDASASADSLAALGHPVRLRLLREILGGRRTAAELAALDAVGTTGQIYHHLRRLTGAGWLHTTGRGRYEVPAARVVPLLVVLAAATP